MKRIILAGGSGFLGRALAVYFTNADWEVVVLTRSPVSGGAVGRQVFWDGETLGSWRQELEGATALVNLAGRSVDCRYHARNRREIMDSRVKPTRVLGEAIQQCAKPPRVWLNASTATIYKHSLDKAMDESGEIAATAEAKDAFSIEVAKAWEHAFEQFPTPATRRVALRMVMVLGHGKNSVLPMLLRLVRWGLGGAMGNGRQFVSWIHEADFCRAIDWIIGHEEIATPINLAAPNPLTNREMMRLVRQTCGRRFGLPANALMLEIGAFLLRTETELILKSRRVIPRRLTESGFQFRFPEFGAACADLYAAQAEAGGSGRPQGS